MGVRSGSRAPTYSPGWNYFWAGCLLACTFGIITAAMVEAYDDQDLIWTVFFAVSDIGCLGMYFWIVACWVNWNSSRWADYSGACTEVCCPDAKHLDTSEPGDPGPLGPLV